MVMAENEGGDEPKEMVSGPKHVWNKNVVTSTGNDAPVMGASDSWPALSDAQTHHQRPKTNPAVVDSSFKLSSDPQVSLICLLCLHFWVYVYAITHHSMATRLDGFVNESTISTVAS